MAWKTELDIRAAGEIATVIANYHDFVENQAGWTLYDNISATEKVFWSQGESGTLSKQYLHIKSDATYIYTYAYVFWNSATHVGYGGAYTSSAYLRVPGNGAGIYRYFGNKDTVGIYSPAASYHINIAGHFGADGDIGSFPKATLSAGASAGSNVVLSVDNTTNFRVASTCIIVDYSTGIRDDVEIVSISSGVSITVATLANAYTSGSVIGESPSLFGYYSRTYGTQEIHITEGGASGTGSINATTTPAPFTAVYAPSLTNDLYVLAPVRWPGYRSIDRGYTTYIRYHFQARETVFLVNNDLQYVINTATGGTTAYLDDTAKSWTPNEFAGKTIAIVAGTGIDQVRVILSNTATRITFRDVVGVSPVAGSNYVLADKSYFAASAYLAYLENEE